MSQLQLSQLQLSQLQPKGKDEERDSHKGKEILHLAD